MARKVTLNYDFIILFALLFAASVGYNLYQDSAYEKLLTAHVELRCSARNDAADLVYIRSQLASCKGSEQ